MGIFFDVDLTISIYSDGHMVPEHGLHILLFEGLEELRNQLMVTKLLGSNLVIGWSVAPVNPTKVDIVTLNPIDTD
jgi:hypothetical protein